MWRLSSKVGIRSTRCVLAQVFSAAASVNNNVWLCTFLQSGKICACFLQSCFFFTGGFFFFVEVISLRSFAEKSFSCFFVISHM